MTAHQAGPSPSDAPSPVPSAYATSSYGAGPVAAAPHGGYGPGPLGRVRGTGGCILLTVVTLGVYSFVWYFQTHEEMKRHTGQGLGGLAALLLAVFVGVASPFLTSSEVGQMYERAGRPRPVSGLTGLWCIPGFLLVVGPVVWFVKTNGALNDYWRSLGAR